MSAEGLWFGFLNVLEEHSYYIGLFIDQSLVFLVAGSLLSLGKESNTIPGLAQLG